MVNPELARPEPIESQHADLLITHAWLVTMDGQRRIYRDGALAIAGDRIVAVGQSDEIERRILANEVIDGRDRFLVTPGFVNCHIHVTGEPLARGQVPDDADWAENVFGWLIPVYMAQNPAEEELAARLAALDMLRSGTTCFLEAGTILDLGAAMRGLTDAGIRGRLGQRLQDRARAPSDDQAAMTRRALLKMERQTMDWPAQDSPLLAAWPMLVGHSSATDTLWREATAMATSLGLGITAHMSPGTPDPDFYLETTGRRPVQHLEAIGVLGPHLSLTHMVHVDEAEVAALARSGTNVTHCPMSAMKGAYGAGRKGRFPEMAAAGVNLQLGTDGANNGNAADMMRAMFVMAGLFKDAREDSTLFSAYEALEAATVNGARGARMEHLIGSLEVGKKADFVLHDRNRPEWRPLHNPVNQLVWSADGRGVHSVWVDGRRVVDSYRSTLIDEEELYAQAEAAGAGLIARVGQIVPNRWPVL